MICMDFVATGVSRGTILILLQIQWIIYHQLSYDGIQSLSVTTKHVERTKEVVRILGSHVTKGPMSPTLRFVFNVSPYIEDEGRIIDRTIFRILTLESERVRKSQQD